MTNITYLLGAGASANTIPVVGQFNQRVIEIQDQFSRVLKEKYRPLNPSDPPTPAKFEEKLATIVRDLNWLVEESEGHQTVDTVAKKFFIKKHMSELYRLKRALMLYFVLEQTILESSPCFTKKLEKRYDGFIASMLYRDGDQIKLPQYVSVLSWNYDSQFELSLLNYMHDGTRINDMKIDHQIFPHLDSSNRTKRNLNEFSFIRLNGEALWYVPSGNGATIFDTLRVKGLSPAQKYYYLIERYNDLFYGSQALGDFLLRNFNFAWEEKDSIEKHFQYTDNLKMAREIASRTDIFVVIGYSFPTFNRDLDRSLFASSKPSRIYLQDYHAESIKSKMINSFNLHEQAKIPNFFHIENKEMDQFIIPFEFQSRNELK